MAVYEGTQASKSVYEQDSQQALPVALALVYKVTDELGLMLDDLRGRLDPVLATSTPELKPEARPTPGGSSHVVAALHSHASSVQDLTTLVRSLTDRLEV